MNVSINKETIFTLQGPTIVFILKCNLSLPVRQIIIASSCEALKMSFIVFKHTHRAVPAQSHTRTRNLMMCHTFTRVVSQAAPTSTVVSFTDAA